MLTYLNPGQSQHAPRFEFFRGERVPCFEGPARADFVEQALRARGHALRMPEVDSTPQLDRIHTPRYLCFLRTAWDQWLALGAANADVQPFPSVWPVRTLRSDVEPANFTARLGLYSMDNGSPLSAGTWAAAKMAADAAVSAAQALQGGERAAFCATRPPGHHAGPDFMGGYCFLNNAAVAAQALRDGGAWRVAVLDVVCPGFVADCLETLEEIAMEGRDAFKAAGGQEFHYVPCLNDNPMWMAALAEIVQEHLQGWPTRGADQPADAAATRERALAAGARA